MIRRKFAVVGLGSFGHYVARTLYESKHDVLAVDRDPQAVEAIRPYASRAMVVDAADREEMEGAGLVGVDVGVVGLGTRVDVSILATMYLKELGVKEIIAKAVTRDHARILLRMGATEVVHPEADTARRLAGRLSRPDVFEEIPFLEGYAIVEMNAPKPLWGLELGKTQLRSRHRVAVVALKRTLHSEEHMIAATPDQVVEKGDRLLLLARPEDVSALRSAFPETVP